MKHGTLGIGYIGIAETMVALFGKTHTFDEDIYNFAYSIVDRIKQFADDCSERNDLNFGCYATPAESCCHTLRNRLFERYGLIKGVTDREYITNSHHIPVYDNISIHEKIDKESKFSKLATSGNITYVELESSLVNNPKAVEDIINYAMYRDVSYLAMNFPIDSCKKCGEKVFEDECPACGSKDIKRLRRVTGYLTTDYINFNKGKIAETDDRVKHSNLLKEI